MENETAHHQPKSEGSDATVYYVIGAVALVALVGAGYLLRPKPAVPAGAPAATEPVVQQPVVVQPTRASGPIKELACELQFFNPVIGFNKYFLSTEGSSPDATKITCKYDVSVEDKLVATETVAGEITNSVTRGGKEFRCVTKGLELKPNLSHTVAVTITDDKKATTECKRNFLFP